MTSPSSSTAQVTQLLVAWSKGDQSALKTLTPLVHEELHRLAHHYMRLERAGHTLQTTALINEAQYLKRGGGAQRVSLDKALTVCVDRDEDLVALDEALGRLAAVDLRKSKVVELRFFGGLSVEETAEALDVSAVTVMREWSMAKAWLFNSLNEA